MSAVSGLRARYEWWRMRRRLSRTHMVTAEQAAHARDLVNRTYGPEGDRDDSVAGQIRWAKAYIQRTYGGGRSEAG